MPNAEGRGIFGFAKEGNGVGPTAATAVYACKAGTPGVATPLLNDSCDNFTAAPWTQQDSIARSSVTASGHTGNGFLIQNSSSSTGCLRYDIAAGNQTADITMGFWYKIDTLSPNGVHVAELLSDTNTTLHAFLVVDSNGAVVMNSGVNIGQSANGVIVPGIWYFIEWWVHLADSPNGRFEARVNGTKVVDHNVNSIFDTKQGGTKTVFDTVRLATRSLGTYSATYDDVYIRNDSTFSASGTPAAPATFSPATYVYQYCNGAWVPVWTSVVDGPTVAPVATYVSVGTSVTISWVEPSPAFSGTWTVKRSNGTIVATIPATTPGTTINVSDDSPLLGTNAYTVTKQIGTAVSAPATTNALTLDFTPTAAPTATTDPGVVGALARVIHLSWVDGPSGNPDSWKILDANGGLVTTVAGNLNTVDIAVQAGYSYRYTVVPVLAGVDGTGKQMANSIATKANPPTNVTVTYTGTNYSGATPVSHKIQVAWTPPVGGCSGMLFERHFEGGVFVGAGNKACTASPYTDLMAANHTEYWLRAQTSNGNNPSDWISASPSPLVILPQ